MVQNTIDILPTSMTVSLLIDLTSLQVEMTLQAHSCPLCPGLITTTATRHLFCFEYFGWDLALSGRCSQCPVLTAKVSYDSPQAKVGLYLAV